MASPPVDLDYPHWDDPVRVGECRFYDPPLPFDAPQPKKNADSAASISAEGVILFAQGAEDIQTR